MAYVTARFIRLQPESALTPHLIPSTPFHHIHSYVQSIPSPSPFLYTTLPLAETMPPPPQTGSSSSTVTRKRKAANTQDDADGNIDSGPNDDVLERVSDDIQILRVAQTGLPEFSARTSLPPPPVPPARSAGAVQQSHNPPPSRRRIAVAATPPAAPAAPPAPQAPVVESRPRRHRPTIPEAAQDRLPRAMSERLMLLYRSGIAGNEIGRAHV